MHTNLEHQVRVALKQLRPRPLHQRLERVGVRPRDGVPALVVSRVVVMGGVGIVFGG